MLIIEGMNQRCCGAGSKGGEGLSSWSCSKASTSIFDLIVTHIIWRIMSLEGRHDEQLLIREKNRNLEWSR